MPLTELFTRHPSTVGESYLGHMAFALGFAGWLFLAGLAALLHAIFPFMFETTASRITARLYERTAHRGGHSTVKVQEIV